jgi:hypothetical protein
MELCRLLLDMTATGAKAEGLARIIDRGVLWQEVRSGGTRSWRNNNSGNISAGGFATHQGAVGDDGRFAIFAARSAGDGAKLTLLRSSSYAELTLDAAIARWAPEGENPTAAYQAFVGS